MFNGVDMCYSEWAYSPHCPEPGPRSSPARTAPIQFRPYWIILSPPFERLLHKKKKEEAYYSRSIWVCECACVSVCVRVCLCSVADWYFRDAGWISRWTSQQGKKKKYKTNHQINLTFPIFYPSFPPLYPSLPPSLHHLSLIRMWSPRSSSSVPRSSRRPCWCWTSWRNTTGTSSPSSRPSSPATRSSSTSSKQLWTTGRMTHVCFYLEELRSVSAKQGRWTFSLAVKKIPCYLYYAYSTQGDFDKNIKKKTVTTSHI